MYIYFNENKKLVFDPSYQIIVDNSPYCQESNDLFSRMTGTIPSAAKIVIDRMIIDYKACGYWDLCDVIVRFNLYDDQAGLLNLKGDYCNPTNPGGLTFTKYIGYQGHSTTGKTINTNYSSIRSGNIFSQNNCHFYRDIHTLPTVGQAGGFDGGYMGGAYFFMSCGAAYYPWEAINDLDGGGYPSRSAAVSHNFHSRTSSTSVEVLSAGIKTTGSKTSTTPGAGNFYIFGLNPSGTDWHNGKYRGYSAGGYLSDTIKARVSTINNTFNTNINGL